MKTVVLYINLFALSMTSCKTNRVDYDASGAFEAVETIVPAEADGVIRELLLEEGQTISAGKALGYIDTVALFLKKRQLEAQATAVLSKRPNVAKEIASLQEELRHAKNEQERLINLVRDDAATPKELDAATAQVNIIRKRIEGQQSSLGITSFSLQEETAPLYVQIEQLDDQLRKCKIVNPITGTILAKYVEVNEMATIGKPLYRIADTKKMILRAYVTSKKLGDFKIGQRVQVQVDKGQDAFKNYAGIVEWVSDKAEFTPKTIQTKDERANLVYAMKVKVENDGYLKIGMYGQVVLAPHSNEQK
ncbi:HlyD family efflux transporter periplasmic adaptor subunit [Olivibacter sp. CPCC 100613]|uniref:HlyD family secretion protein n=1 Tax=Olivibacter sp. CPCC 100613 TaxID=3079931 RepID=UPI002FF73688